MKIEALTPVLQFGQPVSATRGPPSAVDTSTGLARGEGRLQGVEARDIAARAEGAMTPRVEIEYCTQCRWLLRAAWVAQELLTTFEREIGEVALVPGKGGVFDVRLDGEVIFSRQQQKRFPEAKEVKQLVRDRIAPEKLLGHSDRQ
jgi:selenoprotein W-related protein